MMVSWDIAPSPMDPTSESGIFIYLVLALLAVGSVIALWIIRRKRK